MGLFEAGRLRPRPPLHVIRSGEAGGGAKALHSDERDGGVDYNIGMGIVGAQTTSTSLTS